MVAYFKFEKLPDEVRKYHKIRSKFRLDCTQYYNPSHYKGLTDFVNKKGQLFFYCATNSVAYKDKTHNAFYRSDISLSNSSMNFSSILYDCDNCNIGYGYPNPRYWLKAGKINPMYNFRFDAYLFRHNDDFTLIELIIVPNGKNHIDKHYNNLLNNVWNDELSNLYKKLTPFYNYSLHNNK